MSNIEEMKIRLKIARRNKKLSQKALADRVNTTQYTVWFYENKIPRNPDINLLNKISNELDINLPWLMFSSGPILKSDNVNIAA